MTAAPSQPDVTRPAVAAWTLPSALGARFGVLACAVLATTMALVNVVASNILDVPDPEPGTRCWPVKLGMFGQGQLALPGPSDPSWYEQLQALRDKYPDCFARPQPSLPLPVMPLAALVFLGACLVAYFAWPYWRIVREGLVKAEALTGVGTRLRELRDVAGVRVRFVVDLESPRVTGLAFGHAGRRYIALNRGLIALADRDPAEFRGVVLHELAHVKNRDLDVAYFTVLLWRIFVGVFLIPIVLLFNDALDNAHFYRSSHFGLLLQVGILAFAILLCHQAVLRERELEADQRSGAWGASDALRRIFARVAPRSYDESRWPCLRRFLDGLIELHPEPWRRAAALGVPGTVPRAYTLPAAQALILGLVVGMAWTPNLLVLGTLGPSVGLLPDSSVLPAVALPALAPLTLSLGLAVGMLVWRAALATHVGVAVWRRIHLFGMSLGAGLAGGELLTPQHSVLGPGAFGVSYTAVVEPPGRLAYAGLLLAGAWLFVCWSAVSAAAWRPFLTRPGRRSPGCTRSHRPATVVWLAAIVGAVAVTVCLTPVLGNRLQPEPAAVTGDAGRYIGYLADGFAEVVPPWALVTLLMTMLALPVAGLLTGPGSCYMSLRRQRLHRQDATDQ